MGEEEEAWTDRVLSGWGVELAAVCKEVGRWVGGWVGGKRDPFSFFFCLVSVEMFGGWVG